MKLTFPKDFCLWIVPSNDGKVHKLRFTLTRVLLCGALISLAFVAVLFVTSDYTRVQVLRAKNILHIKKLSHERDRLLQQKDMLDEDRKSLQIAHEKALNFQKSMGERMLEMRSFLESAESLGLLPQNTQNSRGDTQVSNDEDALGGMEIDCVGNDCLAASDSELAVPLALSIDSDTSLLEEADVLRQLDSLAEAVRILPIRLPTNGHITSQYGPRRSPFTRRVKVHKGIDFSTPTGSYIYSTADGIIKSVKRSKTYGLSIDVEHNERLVTRYAHLSRALVNQGEKICAGEVLALAGSSGRSTGPHLHYEIIVDGKALDPLKVISLGSEFARILQ